MGVRARCRRLLASVLVAILVIGGCSIGSSTRTSFAAPAIGQSRTTGTVPIVGPLFHDGLHEKHECTATVLASVHGDLAITAAHCVTGTGAGVLFAPGYDKGATPYGVWTVRRVFVDPAWMTSHDTDYDYAILQLTDQYRGGRTVSVAQVTGGAQLGLAPVAGSVVTAVAYNGGSGDLPIQCRTRVYYTGASPTFDCHGYVGGSSGSPWLASVPGSSQLVVEGVIGGLHAGGCHDYTSYSAPFGLRAVLLLFLTGFLGLNPMSVPAPISDGC